jgi:hypothetical protein
MIAPNVGFSITDVVVDGVSIGAVSTYSFNNVVSNHIISATFTGNANKLITASAGVNGSISPSGSVSVPYGSDQSFAITPNAGHVITDLVVDDVSQGDIPTYTFINVQQDHTIVASFAVAPPPTFTSITPSSGSIVGGTSVTITGTDFTGATVVTFGGTPAVSFSVIGDTAITATTPTHAAGVVNVVITAPGGTATGTNAYAYSTGLVPLTGVSITGTTQVGSTLTSVLAPAGATATYQWQRSTTSGGIYTAISGATFSTYTPVASDIGYYIKVTATGTGGYSGIVTSAAVGPVTTVAPTVTGIIPTSGPEAGGTSVTITGTGLTGATSVMFGSTAATSFTVNSATQLTATSPAGSGIVNVTIITPGGTATGINAYSYSPTSPPPVFSQISPTSGPIAGGSSVMIRGHNFVAGGSFGVTIGGAPAMIISINSIRINAITPAGTVGTQNVVVINNDVRPQLE